MSSNRVLISEISSDARRSILFQAALFWAEEGCKVLYLTKNKLQSIPLTVHGPQIPSSEVLAKIRIIYHENIEELLKFVVDILTFRDVIPRVILVEEVDEYTTYKDSGKSDLFNLTQVCATLCHVATCCAQHCGLPTYLLVTVAAASTKIAPVTVSMFDVVWTYNSASNTLTRKMPINFNPVTQLTLVTRSDGAFVLTQVKSLFFHS